MLQIFSQVSGILDILISFPFLSYRDIDKNGSNLAGFLFFIIALINIFTIYILELFTLVNFEII